MITRLEKRIEDLEDDLITKNFPEEKQSSIETELVEIRKLLETNKTMLSTLHKHNVKSFSFAIVLICGFFALYVLYILIVGFSY